MVENWDIPWKNLLDRLLRPVLEIFFPAVHDAIDWSEEVENLETELQSLSRDAAFGTRRADKLFRVKLKTGEYKRLLLHIEVQTTVETSLPERILTYWYRIFDHYGEKPISLVILGDDNPNWRPNLFREENLGFRIELEYPIYKMLDFKYEDYADSDNPMVLVGVAYLKAHATRGRLAERLEHKVELTRQLLAKGYDETQADEIFRLIDWMMVLPEAADIQFRERVQALKENQNMRYVTSIERLARKEGLQEGLTLGIQKGLQEGIEKGIEKGREEGRRGGQASLIQRFMEQRFGSLPAEYRQRLDTAALSQLSHWGDRVLTASTLDEVFRD